jgi:hypothetical protein
MAATSFPCDKNRYLKIETFYCDRTIKQVDYEISQCTLKI